MSDAATDEVKKKNQNLDQYLTFYLDTEEYGVDILSGVEIRGWEEPTPVPAAHPQVKGIINMRGTIVPVIDLRNRFKLSPKDITAMTVIIVLQVEKNGKKRINNDPVPEQQRDSTLLASLHTNDRTKQQRKN